MGFYGIVLIIIFLYIIINALSRKHEENNELQYSRQLNPMEVTSNRAEEVSTEDDLPPYTPPTPKTKAAMADLPPSYDETFDISEPRVPMNNNASSMINNDDGSHVNMNTNSRNTINMPAPCVIHSTAMNNYVNYPTTTYVNPYYNYNAMPEIVVDPMNYRTATVA